MAGQEKESPERMEKMQLGIRLHDIKKAPLEERLAIAHEQGFACGHLALAKVISEYPVDDGALTPGYAMYLKKIFAANQLDVAVLGCYLNLAILSGLSFSCPANVPAAFYRSTSSTS